MMKYHYHCDCSTGCCSLSTLPPVDVAKSPVSQLRKQTLGAEITCASHSAAAVVAGMRRQERYIRFLRLP